MLIKKFTRQSKKNIPYANVRALLILQGIRNKDLVEALNVSPAAISRVLSCRMESRRIKEGIAEILGASFENLWGKRKVV